MAPGQEEFLADEARAAGFAGVAAVPGGVTLDGGLPQAMRANLVLHGATRVLWRIAEFRALHLAQLDKRARRVDWAAVLRPDVPVRVDAACHASRIYHAGAAAERVATAISETVGAPVRAVTGNRGVTDEDGTDDGVGVRVRIDDDLCTISLDTSGAPLHKRGLKGGVGKAPLRETLAALFLREMGFDGTMPVLDPMCGSGTFPIEAATIAAGLWPGRARSFAFERLAGYDPALRAALTPPAPRPVAVRFFGRDRDAGAVRAATDNAARAGVAHLTDFAPGPIGALERPDGPPGIVLVNPPYGARIGEKKLLFGLHGALGAVLRDRFAGWRVGIVTPDAGLARATGLPFLPQGMPVAHGGFRVTLWKTAALP